jgi:hypothetical protein
MTMYQIDTQSISSVKRSIALIKAEHATKRIITVLEDYYKGSSIDISKDAGLESSIYNELTLIFHELRR